jgi:hypothetical protein
MSNPITRSKPLLAAAAAAPATPPAGPLSSPSLARHASAGTSPPALVMTCRRPPESVSRIRARYVSIIGAR